MIDQFKKSLHKGAAGILERVGKAAAAVEVAKETARDQHAGPADRAPAVFAGSRTGMSIRLRFKTARAFSYPCELAGDAPDIGGKDPCLARPNAIALSGLCTRDDAGRNFRY